MGCVMLLGLHERGNKRASVQDEPLLRPSLFVIHWNLLYYFSLRDRNRRKECDFTRIDGDLRVKVCWDFATK